MPILTAEERTNVRNYQYHGGDSSPIYKYILSPLAQFCVDYLTPKWVAPNVITLTGLIIALVATVLTMVYNPLLTSTGPRWLHLVTGAGLFLYQTLDNMDGKQARRTGSSSALGMLFDHGCDAINACLNVISMSSVLGAGWTVKMFLPITCAFIPFYFQTWEEYYLGAMILPPFNGPTEGLIMCMIACVFTYTYGTEWFQTARVELPSYLLPSGPIFDAIQLPTRSHPYMTPMGICMVVGLGTTFVTMFVQVGKVLWVLRSKKQSVVKPLVDLLPFLVFYPSIFYWFAYSPVALVMHPFESLLLISAVFIDMVTHLMLMHICKGSIKPFDRHGAYICGLFALYTAFKPAALSNVYEAWAIFVVGAFFSVKTTVTIARVCQEVSETLGIFVLKLGKRHAKD